MQPRWSYGLLLLCACAVVSATPWLARPPPPPPPPPPPHHPGPSIAELFRHAGFLRPPEKFPWSHLRGRRPRFGKLKTSISPIIISPIDGARVAHFEDTDLLGDEDEVPIIIQKSPKKVAPTSLSSVALLDNLPVDVEAVHLIRRLLQLQKRQKIKPKTLIDGKAHHIIISQGPAETVTSIQPPSNACIPVQNGLSGAPRSAIPVGSVGNGGPQPTPNGPLSGMQQAAPLPAPIQPNGGMPRSGIPTAINSMANPPQNNPVSIVTSQSQGMMNPLVQTPSVALAPVLAEIGALLLGAYPALGLAATDMAHGHHKVGHVAFSKPSLGLAAAAPATLAVPISTSYGAMYPVSSVGSQTEARSSITSELYDLMNALQQQRELHRQQLEQQQQLQQEQQNLLQQQRSQLAQLQPQTQMPAVQPMQPMIPQTSQPDLQGRSVFPTGENTGSSNPLTVDGLQQLLQPGTSSVVTGIPQTIITLTTADDDEGVPLIHHPLLQTARTVKKRKKFLSRRLWH